MPVAPGRLIQELEKDHMLDGSRIKLAYHHKAKEPNPARRPP
jgi:hypothetical protein